MSLGHVMLDLMGLELTAEEQELLQHPQVGGIILFCRNYQSPEQLNQLISSIRQATTRRLLIAVDHEGGRVQRFRQGFTHIPPMGQLGKLYDENSVQAKQWAHDAGWLMASELLAFDIDFSFAPVLDVDLGVSQVIGNRSYHQDPNIIVELGKAFCDGVHQAGMATVGKHFPGHGSVAADSHHALPIDERSYATIAQYDLLPFQRLVPVLDGIMPAHIIYPLVDGNPAGFSPFWLQTVLRERLNFQGVIFSDDLSMVGAEVMGDFAARARTALMAGCDMVLVCNNRPAASAVLETLGSDINQTSQRRFLTMTAKGGQPLAQLQGSAKWKQTVEQLKELIPTEAS